MPNPDERAELVRFFKALADESRLKIVGLLAERPRAVDELAAHLGLESPTVSHHLRTLQRVGLVQPQARTHHRYYHLDHERLRTLAGRMLLGESLAGLAVGTDAEAYERKVLATFVTDGRVAAFPLVRKKQRVVLRWIARQLDPDRGYDEASLRARLADLSADPDRMLRELLDERMVVWRVDLGAYARAAWLTTPPLPAAPSPP